MNACPEPLSPQNRSLQGFSGFSPCSIGDIDVEGDILSSPQWDYTVGFFNCQLGNPPLGPTPLDIFTSNIENATADHDYFIVFDALISMTNESSPTNTFSPGGSFIENHGANASSSSDHVYVSPSLDVDASDRQDNIQLLDPSASSTPIPPCAKTSSRHSSLSRPQTVRIPRAVPLLRCHICAESFVHKRDLE